MDPIATVQSLLGIVLEIRRRFEQAGSNRDDLDALLQRIEDILTVVTPLNATSREVCHSLEILSAKMSDAKKLALQVAENPISQNLAVVDCLAGKITEINVAIDRLLQLLHLSITVASASNSDKRTKSNLFNLGYCFNAIDLKSAALTNHDFPVELQQQALEGVLCFAIRFSSYCELLGLKTPDLPNVPKTVSEQTRMLITELVTSVKQFLEGVVVPSFPVHIKYVQFGMFVFLFEIQPDQAVFRDDLQDVMVKLSLSPSTIEEVFKRRGEEVHIFVIKTIMDIAPKPEESSRLQQTGLALTPNSSGLQAPLIPKEKSASRCPCACVIA